MRKKQYRKHKKFKNYRKNRNAQQYLNIHRKIRHGSTKLLESTKRKMGGWDDLIVEFMTIGVKHGLRSRPMKYRLKKALPINVKRHEHVLTNYIKSYITNGFIFFFLIRRRHVNRSFLFDRRTRNSGSRTRLFLYV